MQRPIQPVDPAPTAPAGFGPDNPVRGILHLVGNTPLLELRLRFRGRPRRLFAKYEPLNLTGSIKDRMAAHILGRAYEEGLVRPGAPILEASSGNTAISFAAIGRALGHPVRIYMPDWMSRERVAILEAFGARLHPVSREDGGFLGSIAMAREEGMRHPEAFLPSQFSNPWNSQAHETGTGREILFQLGLDGLRPEAFVAGVGTGGTVMGVGAALRAALPGVRVHPLEPSGSPVLTTGCKGGDHRIQGISDEFVPEIVDLDLMDAVVGVPDGDAVLMARKLSRELGLGVGISSGANVLGALRVLEQMGGDATVVTVLPDSNKKYLSTDLFRDEPVRNGYLSPAVTFESYRAIPACLCPHQE